MPVESAAGGDGADAADGGGEDDDSDDGGGGRQRVTLPPASLAPFRRLSLYNSPYPAHDRGCAVDLYPDSNDGVSPVAGEVVGTRTVRTPERPYAADHDHLILLALDEGWCAAAGVDGGPGLVARVLHVDPAVEAGDRVAVGDSLGEMVRSGFFAPWVDNHVHLGFRTPDQHLHRASGSLPLALPVDPTPLVWDGTGTVVETGDTYVVLDAPDHPGPETGWCGVGAFAASAADGDAAGERGGGDGAVVGVLDGGLPHYDGGGLLGVDADAGSGPVSLLGRAVGDRVGQRVAWRDVGVAVGGRPARGLSLFLAAAGPAGAKVVCPGHDLDRGERVAVRITPVDG
jgi:hypothetical protein